MSGRLAVSVQNLSKKYRLFNSPKERLKEVFHPFRKQFHSEFWALRDISFDICEGQTVGILGRNGSGKSTLLEIVTQILKPTSGNVVVNGRVALLELGAGFNVEFTGRENVILGGAIFGFSRDEMLRRIPAIEDFAEIGEFFDQPVKVYSSGMYTRLAFAAAINTDPDILIIDEVLAVGDARFQLKCYQKFEEFQKAGKTILLVTHSSETVVKLCDFAILLDKGRLVKTGEPRDVANLYMDILFGSGPRLVKSIHDHNIVSLRGKHYALPQSLGEVDFNVDPSVMPGVIVGGTLKDVESLLNNQLGIPQELVSAGKRGSNRIEVFLEEIPVTDHCVFRSSYNKNEHRYGNMRAEIIDYLLVCEEVIDPIEIRSCDSIDVYMKVAFHDKVECPVYGFAVKTVDGVQVSGSNTWVDKIQLTASKEGDVVVFCYSMKMVMAGGDFFITLAIAERVDGCNELCDHRTDFIHIKVLQEKEGFIGLVDIEAKSKVISETIRGQVRSRLE